jgi:MFS family permease
MTMAASKWIEETLQPDMFESLGPVYGSGAALGSLIAYLIAEILPKDDDTEGLLQTELWRVIYFYFPLSLLIIFLSLCVFVARYDSPKYLIHFGRLQEAKATLKNIYKNCNDQNVDNYI